MDPYVGQRLSFDSHNCTVRYIGPVAGTKGEWLGVEWDDPTRGKHDGAHQGVRYFTCLQTANAGSFVRPNRPSDYPDDIDFLKALRDKYVEAETADDANPVYFNGKLAEEVGFDKIRRQMAALKELKVVILDRSGIAGIRSRPSSDSLQHVEEAMQAINSTCPNIRQLDLSHSLLENWVDVSAICRPLIHLRSLDVSWNRFTSLTTQWWTEEDNKAAFMNIVELSLDSVLLCWTDIVKLVAPFTQLKTLGLAGNQFTQISAELPLTLSSLNLSNNSFRSLEDVGPLSNLPSLERLSLRACPIASLGHGTVFSHLRFLDIYETQLSPFMLIDIPVHFPALDSLRCSFVDETDSILTIARIGSLKTLNYSAITPAARKDAELFYLSQIAKEISLAVPADEAKIVARHRRYRELCIVHGEPTIQRAEQELGPEVNTLATRFIVFSCFDHRTEAPGLKISDYTKPNFRLHLPMSWNIYRIYASVAEKLGILPLYLKLIWETDELDPVSTEKTWDTWDVSSDEGDASGESTTPKWAKREVFLHPGPREIGHWIESNEARLRIESNET